MFENSSDDGDRGDFTPEIEEMCERANWERVLEIQSGSPILPSDNWGTIECGLYDDSLLGGGH